MNLKNNQITLGEVLKKPAARDLLQKKFPQALSHPLAGPAQNLTVAQAMEFAGLYVPRSVVEEVLRELKRL
jgi:hypothetical protein